MLHEWLRWLRLVWSEFKRRNELIYRGIRGILLPIYVDSHQPGCVNGNPKRSDEAIIHLTILYLRLVFEVVTSDTTDKVSLLSVHVLVKKAGMCHYTVLTALVSSLRVRFWVNLQICGCLQHLHGFCAGPWTTSFHSLIIQSGRNTTAS